MSSSETSSPVVSPLQWAALIAVVVAAVACSVCRVPPADVPWHLATGRLIWETGSFPTTNTLSWTHPDHPLYQQYPLFQLVLFGTWKTGGFGALSLVNAGLWLGAMALWLRWAGSWRQAAHLAPLWLVALLGVQRHLLLRPDVASMVLLAALLLCIEGMRREQSWRWVGLSAGVMWLWANSHQLFFIGLAVQVAFLVHLGLVRFAVGRWGIDPEDDALPLRLPLATLGASVLACVVTPLGPRMLLAPLQSILTVLTQGAGSSTGAHAGELLPFWTDPIAVFVVLVGVVALVWVLIRGRGRWQPFELAMAALGLLLVLVALRGIGMFAVLVFAVVSRMDERDERTEMQANISTALSIPVVLFALAIGATRIAPEPAYQWVQPGVGRTVGDWSDSTVEWLDRDRPPGRLLNLDWAVANTLIWSQPELPVFADPRFETYPKEFLLRVVAAEDDDAALQGLIDEYQPSWIVAGLRKPGVIARVAHLLQEGQWALVHADTENVVLFRRTPELASWWRHRQLLPTQISPTDWLPEHPVLHAQQRVRVGALLRAIGDEQRAEALFDKAREQVEHPAVAGDLARFGG